MSGCTERSALLQNRRLDLWGERQPCDRLVEGHPGEQVDAGKRCREQVLSSVGPVAGFDRE